MKQLKKAPKFNWGHFPVGTVAKFVDPTGPYLDKDDPLRIYEDQAYPLVEYTVLGIRPNGPHSFVVEVDAPCTCVEGSNKSINIQWCREIVKRGPGEVKLREWITPDKKPFGSEKSNKHHSQYYTDDLRYFILEMLYKHPAYANRDPQHYYDLDKIMKVMMERVPYTKTRWVYAHTINKKKFHKILKQALAGAKTSRKKAQQEENAFWNDQHMDDYDLYDVSTEADEEEDVDVDVSC